jgi:hypothetical protein
MTQATTLPPLTRSELLGRCALEADRMQDIGLALGAIAGVLRRDIQAKSDDGPEVGLGLGELDGLAVALALLSDRLYSDGDTLEVMAQRQGEAA